MTSKPKDMPLTDLIRRSRELEQRVLELQGTLSQLRAEMEDALCQEAAARHAAVDRAPAPIRRRRAAVPDHASQKAD